MKNPLLHSIAGALAAYGLMSLFRLAIDEQHEISKTYTNTKKAPVDELEKQVAKIATAAHINGREAYSTSACGSHVGTYTGQIAQLIDGSYAAQVTLNDGHQKWILTNSLK